MSLIVNGIEITSLIFNDTELEKLIYNGTVVWEKNINIEDVIALLTDFDYIVDDKTVKITGWKQTLNGEPSTEMIIPDNNLIVL